MSRLSRLRQAVGVVWETPSYVRSMASNVYDSVSALEGTGHGSKRVRLYCWRSIQKTAGPILRGAATPHTPGEIIGHPASDGAGPVFLDSCLFGNKSHHESLCFSFSFSPFFLILPFFLFFSQTSQTVVHARLAHGRQPDSMCIIVLGLTLKRFPCVKVRLVR